MEPRGEECGRRRRRRRASKELGRGRRPSPAAPPLRPRAAPAPAPSAAAAATATQRRRRKVCARLARGAGAEPAGSAEPDLNGAVSTGARPEGTFPGPTLAGPGPRRMGSAELSCGDPSRGPGYLGVAVLTPVGHVHSEPRDAPVHLGRSGGLGGPLLPGERGPGRGCRWLPGARSFCPTRLPTPPSGTPVCPSPHGLARSSVETPPRRGVLRSPASPLGRAPAPQKPPEISQFRGRGPGASDPAQSVLPQGPTFVTLTLPVLLRLPQRPHSRFPATGFCLPNPLTPDTWAPTPTED